MKNPSDDYPFDRFTPDLRRFVVAEMWMLAASLGIAAGLGYWLRSDSRDALLMALGVGLVTIVVQASLGRRSRRIIIGDTWIEGPARVGRGSVTVQFDMINWAASGICRGQLRIRSTGGDTIKTKTAWYTPEDFEEMTRLIRDRSGGRQLPARLTWMTRLTGTRN